MAFDDDMIKKKTPLQVLNKSPDYFRRNTFNQPQKRSISAAEQLFEGRQDYITTGQNGSNVTHRLEYFNKNKKGLLDGGKSVTRQDGRHKQIHDDSVIEATRRSRKEQKERMHRARSVERLPVQRLVITSFSSDESIEGDTIPNDQKDDASDIPFGSVLNRISFFSNTDKTDSKKPSAIINQSVRREPVGNNRSIVSVSNSKAITHPQKPPKPQKPSGVCHGKENQKGDSNITSNTIGTESVKSLHHIGQKNGDNVNHENNNSFKAVNKEKPRRIIEAKPLLFPTSTKTNSSNISSNVKQKENLLVGEQSRSSKFEFKNTIGNSLLCSAKNRLAINESNAIQAVPYDIQHNLVDKSSGSKPTCAERLGVQTRQEKNYGDRRIVASHSFNCFPPEETSSDKVMNKSQDPEGFVKRHVRQRSAPDAVIKALLKSEDSPHNTMDISETTSKDDNSIPRQSQQHTEHWQRKPTMHESASYADRFQATEEPVSQHLKTEKKLQDTNYPYIPSKQKKKPAIPEKPKKPMILKKPLNENVLKRIEQKNILKSSPFYSRKTVPVKTGDLKDESHTFRITDKRLADCKTNPPNIPSDLLNNRTKLDSGSHNSEDKGRNILPTDTTKKSTNNDEVNVNSEITNVLAESRQSYFTKQYKPIKFQPRRKSSDLKSSADVCSETSSENIRNNKELKELNHECKGTSQVILDEDILKYPSARSITSRELQMGAKSVDPVWKLRPNMGYMPEGNKQSNQYNYYSKPVTISIDQDEYQDQLDQPTEVFNKYSLSCTGANQGISKRKSSIKPFTTYTRHKPYEYSLPSNTDWSGKKTKQYTNVAPPTGTKANPESSVENGGDWTPPINEYSAASSKPTDRNLLVFDCDNVLRVDQEGRIKQNTITDQDYTATTEAHPTLPIKHQKSYSSISQSEYEQDTKMDRFFRPVVKRVNSWNDHVSRERRRDKESKELYKKTLKENKQKLVLNQQCKKLTTSALDKQENKFTSSDNSNVQFCNTKNVENKPTAKELLIIRTEGVNMHRKPDEGNNNSDLLKKEQLNAKVIGVNETPVSKPQHPIQNDNQIMQCSVKSEELRARQASVDEVHEALARLNSSKNSSSPSVSSKKNSYFSSPVVMSHLNSDKSREVSPHTPSYKKSGPDLSPRTTPSYKNSSPDSVFVEVDEQSEAISTEKIVEDTITFVIQHEEQSAMKARRSSKELFDKRNSVIKKEKPQFLDLKNEEKPIVTDTVTNYNSLKRKQHLMRRNSWGSSSDVSTPQVSTPSRRNSLSELDTFFEQMGLDDNELLTAQSPHELDNVFHTMYMEALDNDADSDVMSEGSRVSESGLTKKLKKIPDNTSSIITRNAKVIKWLCQCKKAKTQL